MPITSIDSTSALVVIDLQKGIVALPTVHPVQPVVDNALKLIDAFRAKGRPVVLVRVGWSADFSDFPKSRVETPLFPDGLPDQFAEYIDALKADPARDILILKHQWGAFFGTELDLQLRRRGITNIVLCGIATSIGVESTARDAYDRAYSLTFASDAMTDVYADAHNVALGFVFPRIGEVGTTAEIVSQL